MQVNADNSVDVFKEKVKGGDGWINGGFFVLKPEVFNILDNMIEDTMWEDQPLQALSKSNQLMAFQHHGFWKCMDALRDRIELEELWSQGNAKWKIW